MDITLVPPQSHSECLDVSLSDNQEARPSSSLFLMKRTLSASPQKTDCCPSMFVSFWDPVATISHESIKKHFILSGVEPFFPSQASHVKKCPQLVHSCSAMHQTQAGGAALLPNVNKFFFNYLWGHEAANRPTDSCPLASLPEGPAIWLCPCSTSHMHWKIDNVYLLMQFCLGFFYIYFVSMEGFSFIAVRSN